MPRITSATEFSTVRRWSARFARETRNANLPIVLRFHDDRIAGLQRNRQLELLNFAKQHDLGPVAVRHMHHRRAGTGNHVQPELVVQMLAAQLRIVFVHGPQCAEGAVAGFGTLHVEQFTQGVGGGNVVQGTQGGQRVGAEGRFIFGGFVSARRRSTFRRDTPATRPNKTALRGLSLPGPFSKCECPLCRSLPIGAPPGRW